MSVTFVYSVKRNKHGRIVSPLGSHIILVFLYQKLLQYSDGKPRNGGFECRWGRQNCDSQPISRLHPALSTLQLLYTQLRWTVASWLHSLLVAISGVICCSQQSSSSRMRVINHNWSATKQRPHLQSVAEISRHSVLSGDRI